MNTEMEKWRDLYLDYESKYKNHVDKFVFYLVENNFADAPSEINKEHLEGSVEY